ncbi:MAG TPA: cytochrome c biogenesis protein CcsA [Saprospiraceae bacterium]|nr:cytochrome c biogenesis protein CcsA [Saprospiraceae bacterium]HMQ84139.1 cytochrome c biogenesis protein CcsA [Saprospiraceae bacterium]
MIKKHWWKALGVVILLYVFTMGMLVPLGTGIVKITPNNVRTGESIRFEVKGYNAHFKDCRELRAWLKLDDERALGAEQVEVVDNQSLFLNFQFPSYLPVAKRVQDFTLVLDNELDGTAVLPSAVFVTQDSIDPEMGLKAWQNTPIEKLNEQWTLSFPFRNILAETIRNTYFHVPMWFSMLIILVVSVVYSVRYLRKHDLKDDAIAVAFTTTGILLGVLGLVTGAIWAKHTWGKYWSGDIKQNMTAIALLIYLAYFVLRAVFEDPEKKARIAAVYNIFAFINLIPLLFVIPRLTDSLHPGSGGNPAMGGEDLDNTMRMIFYPAIIGWTLIAVWISNLLYRMKHLELRLLDD